MAFNLLAKLISLGPMFFPVFIRSNNNFKIVRTFPYYIRSRQLLWGPKLNRAKNPWDRLFCLWLLIQYYNKETNIYWLLWGVGRGDWGGVRSIQGGGSCFFCVKTKKQRQDTFRQHVKAQFSSINSERYRQVLVLSQNRTAVSKVGVIVLVCTEICFLVNRRCFSRGKKVRVTVIHAS